MTTHPFLELRNLSVWTWRFLTNQDVGEWIVLREGCYLKCVVQTQPCLLRASMLGMVSNTQLWPFLFDPHDMVAGGGSTTRTATQAQWVVVVRPANDEKEQWNWRMKAEGGSAWAPLWHTGQVLPESEGWGQPPLLFNSAWDLAGAHTLDWQLRA